MTAIMDERNPPPIKNWPYVTTLILIPLATVVGSVTVSIMRPGQDNAALVTQILGFGVTITMATMAYLKSSYTRQTVNNPT